MLFIFDMGGVVTTTAGKNLYEKISEKLGITMEEFYEFCGKDTLTDYLQILEDGKMTSREFWPIFSKRSGIKVNADWFRLLFHPVLNVKTVEIIKKLKSEGNRVVCGTNTIDSHYDNHLSRGDYAFFDTTYASIHMGVSKPDPEFWRLILECEGFKPENAFFTDDKEENIKGALECGIKAVRFESAENLRKELSAWL